MITAKECLAKIREAIRLFGEYSYDDKGPEEVMDVEAILKAMENMTGKQIADVLAEVRKKKYGERFVSSMLFCLQDREDVDDLYEDERVKDLF